MFRLVMRPSLGMRLAILAAIPFVVLTALGGIAYGQSFNNAPVIFDVRRSLPLEPSEPVFHDFYINAGPEAGFKKGMYLTVVRPVPIHDPIQNKQQATLNITIGRLQVIQVDRGIAVARLHSELGDDERPTVEFEAIMIGDRIDTAANTLEAPKVKPEQKREKPAAKAVKAETAMTVVEPSSGDAVIEAKVETKEEMRPESAPASNVENAAPKPATAPASDVKSGARPSALPPSPPASASYPSSFQEPV